ncbi:DUF5133 domain-containing protein [Streptomyces sp. NTH33]|uniref:DUF5133 domain-containing protein n=1 Tax=Streptomyces sp. NTH33 TaxID=1735453 RepID=UPI000DA81373|nr:DUF5133 domain-containing protein [Streptomyces sp. NTH33]PZH15571.1 DUF5133 domain-containing protein [Streptomyces sp. NTH33]
MLKPHPEFLRKLLADYETAPAESTRAQDLAYTLCVSTGTRDVNLALQTAHRMLTSSGTTPLAA